MDLDVRQLTIPLCLVLALSEFCVHGTVLVETPIPKTPIVGVGSVNLDCIIRPTANERITQVTWFRRKEYDRYYRVIVQVPISLDGDDKPSFPNSGIEARSNVSVRPGRNGRTHVRLKISKMTCQDEGSYKCRVDVFGGEAPDQQFVNVTVTVPPKVFSIRQISGSLVENKMVTFQCSAGVGKPAGKLEWKIIKFEGDRLKSYPVSGSISMRVGEDSCSPRAVGTIEHAVTGSDEIIRCVIVRDTEEFPLEKRIDVLFSVRSTKIATTVNGDPFAHWLKSIDATAGDEVVLTCSAKGHPQPQYRWRHVKNPGRDSGSWLQTENGTLILDDVSKNNTGKYVCTSTNIVSGERHDSVKEIILNIKDRPMLPPTTVRPPSGDTKSKIMPVVAGVGVLMGLIVTTICAKCCGG